ncbi:hypothetical protein CPC08DRAFT_703587 [Agrocybe pediades]|nr:hypothetical protein CPC08DRAFT_703587 [Agrocybe pediades]
MPLLGGLFSRKNKSSSKRDEPTESIHSTEHDSVLSSPTTSSHIPVYGNPIPTHNNARTFLHPDSASGTSLKQAHSSPLPPIPQQHNGSKLRLAFGRKKSAVADTTAGGSDLKDFNTAPRLAPISRKSTDVEASELRRLRPPPSRSAIFAAYGDPNSALSTRSLPNDPSASASDLQVPQTPNPLPKRPSLFPWARQTSSPAPPSPSSTIEPHSTTNLTSGSPTKADAANSFNLKSFRHIRPPSPTNASNVSLTPPVPRPRGQSVNSDSSQRISVAAFREAQARRSLAGSPSPSFRSPSPAPGLPNKTRAISPDNVRERPGPRPSPSSPTVASAINRQRRSSVALAYTSESESSSESSSEDEDDAAIHDPRKSLSYDRPGRTANARAKSEIGHGQLRDVSRVNDLPPQNFGHSSSPVTTPGVAPKMPDLPPRSQSSLGHYSGGVRQRASVSTSAALPSAAAKRASVLIASDPKSSNYPTQDSIPSLPSRNTSQPPLPGRPANGYTVSQKSSKAQSSTESDSEDDAPLASLVAPRRPGSAMSSYSNLHSRSSGNVATRSNTGQPKPLIDINELTGPKRSYTVPEKDSAGFTEGPTLLSLQNKPTYSSSPLVESPQSTPLDAPSSDHFPLTRREPPVKFISPPGSPAKELQQFISSNDVSPLGQSSNGTPSPSVTAEQRRDPITERLTKVVKKNISATASVGKPHRNGAADSKAESIGGTSASSLEDTSRPSQPMHHSFPTSQPSRQVDAPVVGNARKQEPSPVDPELAQLLGTAGIKFITRDGNSSEDSTDTSESEEDEEDEEETLGPKNPSKDRIVPIPVKQMSPPPAFSVTSRPPLSKSGNRQSSTSPVRSEASPVVSTSPRPRSTTLNNSTFSNTSAPRKSFTAESIMAPTPRASNPAAPMLASSSKDDVVIDQSPNSRSPYGQRQRSSTMLTGVPLSSQMARPNTTLQKPFAVRRNSPASSTGDSSSGRTPYTPLDGSDIVDQKDTQPQGRPAKRHEKRRSVSFGDDLGDLKPPTRSHFRETSRGESGSEAGDISNEEDREHRRRERRRTEAKASIELGNVINGRGPVVEDDDDDLPINQTMNARMSTLNPMMAMGNPMAMQMGFGASPSPGWGPGLNQPMLSPAQFMIPPPADPSFLAAHQHAMQIAKQAYQMAVAQQAMAAAADEWERGSAVGGFGGGSVYGGGGGSVYGGSTYGGGGSSASMMNANYGMMNMMQGQVWPSTASVYGGTRSMYGATLSPGDGMISSSRSEYGGGGGRGGNANWSSSRSSYGEMTGPSPRRMLNQGRESGYFPPVPAMPPSQSAGSKSLMNDGAFNSRSRTTSQPATPGRSRKVPPPSSWKNAGP